MDEYIPLEKLGSHVKKEKAKRAFKTGWGFVKKVGTGTFNVGKTAYAGVQKVRKSQTGQMIGGYLVRLGEAQNTSTKKKKKKIR